MKRGSVVLRLVALALVVCAFLGVAQVVQAQDDNKSMAQEAMRRLGEAQARRRAAGIAEDGSEDSLLDENGYNAGDTPNKKGQAKRRKRGDTSEKVVTLLDEIISSASEEALMATREWPAVDVSTFADAHFETQLQAFYESLGRSSDNVGPIQIQDGSLLHAAAVKGYTALGRMLLEGDSTLGRSSFVLSVLFCFVLFVCIFVCFVCLFGAYTYALVVTSW
jgi:hypothetical protein